MRQKVHVVGPDDYSTITRHDQSERAWKRHKNANSDSKTFRTTCREARVAQGATATTFYDPYDYSYTVEYWTPSNST